MSQYLVRAAVVALVACGSPTGSVELAPSLEQSIRLSNGTGTSIYYFAVECDAAAVINWAPCSDPATCRGVRPGESRVIPFSEIGFYEPTATAAIVYWWHLKPAGGGFVPDSIRALRVALTPISLGVLVH